MKKSEAIRIIKEMLKESNCTGTGATFNAGEGAQTATPFAFRKKRKK